jgi:hypothetical protein
MTDQMTDQLFEVPFADPATVDPVARFFKEYAPVLRARLITESRRSYTLHCVLCGRSEAELHHWAQKAIFGPWLAERLAREPLCPEHHRLGHDTEDDYYRRRYARRAG